MHISVCYREIKDKEDTLKLQRDFDRLGNWARKWGMKFQPVKCNMIKLTRTHSYKIQASYTLDLNLNSLLVKRQTDNPSPGAVTGGN